VWGIEKRKGQVLGTAANHGPFFLKNFFFGLQLKKLKTNLLQKRKKEA
jgi:hypothetical protein